MRRLLVCVFSFAVIGSASADDASAGLAKAVHKCWAKPSIAEATQYTVTMLVKLDKQGIVQDITAKSYPKSLEGKVIVQSLSRAIQRCEPYKSIDKTEIEVTFSDDLNSKKFIDPFK